jgi:hypothetical protein
VKFDYLTDGGDGAGLDLLLKLHAEPRLNTIALDSAGDAALKNNACAEWATRLASRRQCAHCSSRARLTD